MTQQNSASVPVGQVARDEATEVGRSTTDAGRQVAGTAAEQAGHVMAEARQQTRNLLTEARGQVVEQARSGQQKATDGLHALADELRSMAGRGEGGTAAELARQAADRVGDCADWIGRREPGDIVEEVRRLARRRPGAFLLGAALAGVVAGRLTRGAVDSQRGDGAPTGPIPVPGPARGDLAGPPSPLPYDAPGQAPLPPGGPLDRPGPVGPGGGPLPPPGRPVPPVAPPPPPGAGVPPVAPPPGPGPVGGAPAHAPRPGSMTVSEYADELEREAGLRNRPGDVR